MPPLPPTCAASEAGAPSAASREPPSRGTARFDRPRAVRGGLERRARPRAGRLVRRRRDPRGRGSGLVERRGLEANLGHVPVGRDDGPLGGLREPPCVVAAGHHRGPSMLDGLHVGLSRRAPPRWPARRPGRARPRGAVRPRARTPRAPRSTSRDRPRRRRAAASDRRRARRRRGGGRLHDHRASAARPLPQDAAQQDAGSRVHQDEGLLDEEDADLRRRHGLGESDRPGFGPRQREHVPLGERLDAQRSQALLGRLRRFVAGLPRPPPAPRRRAGHRGATRRGALSRLAGGLRARPASHPALRCCPRGRERPLRGARAAAGPHRPERPARHGRRRSR